MKTSVSQLVLFQNKETQEGNSYYLYMFFHHSFCICLFQHTAGVIVHVGPLFAQHTKCLSWYQSISIISQSISANTVPL